MSELTINKEYARKFEHRKRREELQREQEKLQQIYGTDDLPSSSESSEDSEAELLTDKVNSKFSDVLSMIRSNDPRLKDPNFQVFSDSDFEEEEQDKKSKSSKPIYYKDLAASSLFREESQPMRGTIKGEERASKQDFLSAVASWENSKEDDLLTFRKLHKPTTKVIKDEDESFLQQYLTQKLWEDKTERLLTYDEIVDSEDDKRDEEIDNFESAYNFRYEEEGSHHIKTYSRNPTDSVRTKKDTRKNAREAKKERKILEQVHRAEEVKRLKNLKKEEYLHKMNLVKAYGGLKKEVSLELDQDFDPVAHDKAMDELFDQNYESESEISVVSLQNAQENDLNLDKIETTVELPKPIVEGAEGDWWLCDGCMQGIPEDKYHFDCTECENYTLCDSCRRTVSHEHRLRKSRVPLGCRPPEDIVYINCDSCSKDITSTLRYDCTVCPDFSLCEGCKLKTDHPHELKSPQDLVDEYFNIDYEDLVGDVKCRFKYRQVQPQHYGFDDSEILEWDDKDLNQVAGLKKLATYKSEKLNAQKLKKKKKFIQKQIQHRHRSRR